MSNVHVPVKHGARLIPTRACLVAYHCTDLSSNQRRCISSNHSRDLSTNHRREELLAVSQPNVQYARSMIRPAAYSERYVKFPSISEKSSINNVVKNLFLGKCIYKQVFPYYVVNPEEFKQLTKQLQQFVPDHNPGSSPDHNPGSSPDHNPGSSPDHNPGSSPHHKPGSSPEEVLKNLRKKGLLGVCSPPHLGGIGVTNAATYPRFVELVCDWTKDAATIRHVASQNAIQHVIGQFERRQELREGLIGRLNRDASAALVYATDVELDFDAEGDTVRLNGSASFESMEECDIILLVVPSTNQMLLIPGVRDIPGLTAVENPSTSGTSPRYTLTLRNCRLSCQLALDGADLMHREYLARLWVGLAAALAREARRVASEVVVEMSRRRRFGYRLLMFQHAMQQVERVEQLCYLLETLPYYFAGRTERVVETRPSPDDPPPDLFAEACLLPLLTRRHAQDLLSVLQSLHGPGFGAQYPQFIQLVDAALPDHELAKSALMQDGLDTYLATVSDRELRRSLMTRLRDLCFRSFMQNSQRQIAGTMSDFNMLYVHHDFQLVANKMDRNVFHLFDVVKECSKTGELTPYSSSLIPTLCGVLYSQLATVARCSRSIFVGNRYYNHEVRMVSKMVSGLQQEWDGAFRQWVCARPYEATSRLAQRPGFQLSTPHFTLPK